MTMQRRTLLTLYACNLLASVGFWFFLPLLPIFLSRRGGSGALVGACGLNGTLKRDTPKGPRYYGFTAWVQDYVRDEQLFAAGLVTPGAVNHARDEIDNWVKRGQVDVVLPLERGATAEIGDANLGLSLTILGVELGRDGDHPIGDVAQLTVRFEVQLGS